MKKWKKIIMIISLALIVLLSILLFNPVRTILSIKKENGFYSMTYYGDSQWLMERLNAYVYRHNAKTYKGGCSLFAALGNSGNMIYGRNYDWPDMPILITKCNPKHGYASIVLTSPLYLKMQKDLSNSLPSLKNKLLFLAAPYYTYDGMNEKGLTISLAKVPTQKIYIDKNKESVPVTYIQHLILNNAKNIDEAVSIIKKYNIVDTRGSTSQHWLIGDSSGKSVIVEDYLDEYKVIPNVEPWQVATNELVYPYYLHNNSSDSENNIGEVPSWRYKAAYEALKNSNGDINWEKGMETLKSVKQYSTQYSVIYDMKTCDVYLSIYQDYNKIFKFNVNSKDLKYTIISNNN